MKEVLTQEINVMAFEDMYKKGWGNHWPVESMITYYNELIKPRISGKKVFELGCGAGANLWYFLENGFDVYGIDTSVSAINRANTFFTNITGGGNQDSNLEVYHFECVNVLTEKTIAEVFPDIKFDVVICINTLSLFDDHDIKKAVGQFKDIVADDGVIYVNMRSINCDEPYKKHDNGLWLAETNRSVDKATWFNMAESKEVACKKCCIDGLTVISARRTLIECAHGEREVYHVFLEKSDLETKSDQGTEICSY